MELVFHDVRPDDWQFGHLMTQGGRVAAHQGLTTAAANHGLAGNRFLDLIAGDQETLLTRVAGLPAAFLAWLVRRRRRPTFAVEAVGGRRQGGVGRIGSQLSAEIDHLLLELLVVLLLLVSHSFEIGNFDLKLPNSSFQLLDPLLEVIGF
jgi:hypothetical protein